MNAKDAISASMDMSDMVLKSYLEDISDDELLTRPAPSANHLAWQLGHLIGSEVHLRRAVCPDSGPNLPDGFEAAHGKETTSSDDPAQFLSKQEYLTIYENQRAASRETLAALEEAKLDEDAPEQFKAYAPTVGHVFNLIASHPLMHSGQFATARRVLEKPIVI